VRQVLDELVESWNRGDAAAFSRRYRVDGTFTNVFGTLHVGRQEFQRRHAEVFEGFLKGTRIAMTVLNLRFVRPEVAVLDVDMAYSGFAAPPPGLKDAHGVVHSSLLMVLVRDRGDWQIAAYHNVWRAA